MNIILLSILFLLISLPSLAQTNEQTLINQVIQAEKNKDFCGDEGIEDVEKARELSQVLVMSAKDVIVELSCNFFAYQGINAYIYYQIDSQGSVQMSQFKIQKYDPKTNRIKEEKTIVGVPLNFNNQNNALTYLTKYRGLGDIGMFYRYQIDFKTNKFILTEQRERDESYIKPTKNPELIPLPHQWPLIYSR